MSVWIECGEASTNITYNLNQMFNKAFEVDDYLDLLEGKTGIEAVPLLDKAINNMANAPFYYMQYDAPNGWGTYVQALPWLISLREDLRNNEAIIEMSR